MKMKNIFNILFAVSISLSTVFAQDTVVVQTLDFNDITKRRGWYQFPSDTSYEKVLMYYTLKCDAATTQDGFSCGEWDYSTFTNLYDHQNTGDARFSVSGLYPDTIRYTNIPTYTYYEQNQYFIVYDNVISESNFAIGTGANSNTETFDASNAANKAQYLWTATELSAAGVTAGNIDKLKFNINTLGSNMNYLSVKMKNSSLSSLSASNYEESGFTDVYLMNRQFPSLGMDSINLTTPFNWDGTSNVVIDFSFTNPTPGNGYELEGSTTTNDQGLFSINDDRYLEFKAGKHVDVPASAFTNINNEVTISFWQFGDAANQPRSNFTFYGVDGNNNRVLNAHLPWSNSRIYWDAGTVAQAILTE